MISAPIAWLRDVLTGPGARADYEQRGVAARAQAAGGNPTATLRQRAFECGARPLPAASWPRPRGTGWEADLQ